MRAISDFSSRFKCQHDSKHCETNRRTDVRLKSQQMSFVCTRVSSDTTNNERRRKTQEVTALSTIAMPPVRTLTI